MYRERDYYIYVYIYICIYVCVIYNLFIIHLCGVFLIYIFINNINKMCYLFTYIYIYI